MVTFAFYIQGLYTYFINKTFFSLCSYFKSKDISFSNCKALKHNKRQARTKGIEPSTQESSKQQNQTKPRYHQLLLPQDQAPSLLIRQYWWQRLCTLQQSLLLLTHHLFTFCFSFLFKEKGKKETTTHSFFCFFSMILWFQFTFDLAPVFWWHRSPGVMFRAAEKAFQCRGDQSPLPVIFTEGTWTELTEGNSCTAALIALMPRALPLS